MVELYLNDTRVYTDNNQVKVYKENPFIASGSNYTLDVTLPMSIAENTQFFASINRIDAAKREETFQCKLITNGTTVIDGTARISQVTQDDVKVQLVNGVNQICLNAEKQGLYIDEMELGDFSEEEWIQNGQQTHCPAPEGESEDVQVRYVYIPEYNLTAEKAVYTRHEDPDASLYVRNTLVGCPAPSLLSVFKRVLFLLGYTIQENPLEGTPAEMIYVIFADKNEHVADALPHWTVKTFLEEFCNFFACALYVDNHKVVRVKPSSWLASREGIELKPVAEYKSEISEKPTLKSILTSNIAFDMETGLYNEYTVIEEDILKKVNKVAIHEDCTSYAEVLYKVLKVPRSTHSQEEAMKPLKTLFSCPQGDFIRASVPTGKDEDGDETRAEGPAKLAPFNPLWRSGAAETIKLKICPAKTVTAYGWRFLGSEVPGSEKPNGGSYGEANTLQQVVDKEVDVPDENEKPDIMSVGFFDGETKVISSPRTKAAFGWTDPWHKPPTPAVITVSQDDPVASYQAALDSMPQGSPYTLSLREDEEKEFCLGRLHRKAFNVITNVRHTFMFIADKMPSPDQMFLVRGHLYLCEKIEANITDGRLDRLMTGYFYEILDQ